MIYFATIIYIYIFVCRNCLTFYKDDYYEIDEKIEEDLEEEMMRDFSY